MCWSYPKEKSNDLRLVICWPYPNKSNDPQSKVEWFHPNKPNKPRVRGVLVLSKKKSNDLRLVEFLSIQKKKKITSDRWCVGLIKINQMAPGCLGVVVWSIF